MHSYWVYVIEKRIQFVRTNVKIEVKKFCFYVSIRYPLFGNINDK